MEQYYLSQYYKVELFQNKTVYFDLYLREYFKNRGIK